MEILSPAVGDGEADVEHPWTEHERRRVTRLCAVITGDASAADDLAQETLLEAWRVRDRLVEPSGRGPWLDAIARNVCRRWRVRQGRLGRYELTSDRPTEQPGAPYDGHDQLLDLLEKEELAELLDRALRLLPAETRDALVARYLEELGPHEIATRLGASREAVAMRLVRGRARMRELLETELRDEPIAQLWVERHGVSWRPTRLPCPLCGRTSTSIRRDPGGGVVELRCDHCDPSGIDSSWRLDNPELAPHLNAVKRPSALVSRMAGWSHAWWPSAIENGRATCTRCGSDVTVRPYRRAEPADLRTRAGWWASCPACGEELTTSLLSLALACPETRSLRARRRRAHAVPTRRVEHDGRRALVVGVRDDVSGDGVDVLFDDATMRLLRVVVAR
jgi:RNA polymerase sigma factor (sigma-70 family)